MSRLLNLLLLLCSLGSLARSQTSQGTVAQNFTANLPQYFVAMGASYDKYATSGPNSAGWISGAISIGSSGMYSISTIDMTQTSSSLRSGVAKVLVRSGNFILLAHADGGITTGTISGGSSGVTLGSFSTGGMIAYDLGGAIKPLKGQNVYVVAVVRVLAITSVSVQPIFEFGFAKGF